MTFNLLNLVAASFTHGPIIERLKNKIICQEEIVLIKLKINSKTIRIMKSFFICANHREFN